MKINVRPLKKVTIRPTPATIPLPAKSADGSAPRKMPAATTATIAPTACPAFMWTKNPASVPPTAAASWSRWPSGCARAALEKNVSGVWGEDEGQYISVHVSVHVPQLECDSPDAAYINDELNDIYRPICFRGSR